MIITNQLILIFINMKIKITEKQLQYIIKENVDDILDKISSVGYDKLKPSEKRKLSHYQKHLEKGGNEKNFVYSDQPEIDMKSGMKFTTKINGEPLIFVFSEKIEEKKGEIEYVGEIFYMGNEYLGAISTDTNGFLIDYDFYDSLDVTGDRLQYIIGEDMHELDNFFQNEVIPKLKD